MAPSGRRNTRTRPRRRRGRRASWCWSSVPFCPRVEVAFPSEPSVRRISHASACSPWWWPSGSRLRLLPWMRRGVVNGRGPVSARLRPCRSAARDEAGIVFLPRCRNLFRSSAAAAIRRPVLSGVPGTVRDGKPPSGPGEPPSARTDRPGRRSGERQRYRTVPAPAVSEAGTRCGRILAGAGFYQCPDPADYPSHQESVQTQHHAEFIGVWIVVV